jgi:hypothetical protein
LPLRRPPKPVGRWQLYDSNTAFRTAIADWVQIQRQWNFSPWYFSQLRWIRHCPPAAFSSEQSCEASSDEENGPTIAR